MKKSLIFSIIAVLFISVFVFALNSQSSPSGELGDSITYNSNVCRQVIRADGTIEPAECSHNLLYDAGKNLIRTYLGDTGGGTDEVDQISLCNATLGCGVPQANNGETYSEFSDCGLSEATGTFNAGGTGNWSISNQFTATCDDLVTNVTRLRNTAGTNFAGNTFTLVTLQSADLLLINWTLSVS